MCKNVYIKGEIVRKWKNSCKKICLYINCYKLLFI